MSQFAEIVVDFFVQIFADQLGEMFVWTVRRVANAPRFLLVLACYSGVSFLTLGGVSLASFVWHFEPWATWLAAAAGLHVLMAVMSLAVAILFGRNAD